MGKFLYPLPKEYYDNSDGYNYHGGHSYYDSKKDQPQHGLGKLDFTCPEGTEVRSMTAGTVVRAGSDSNGKYTSVQVKVSGSYWTDSNELIIRYYHITPSVSEGDTVAQGDVLGTVGDPDVTSSQHLHLDFATSTAPVLLKGKLTYDQLTDDEKTCISTWFAQNNNGASLESSIDDKDQPGGSATNNIAGTQSWGRCWEVIATEAEWVESASTSVSGDLTFIKTFTRGTYYAYGKENVTGGSGRTLIDCSIGEGGIKGSIASWELYSLYGYNYNGDRTTVYLEISDYPSMNGYYYLDDSNEEGVNNIIDFFFYYNENCPFQLQGVVSVDAYIAE